MDNNIQNLILGGHYKLSAEGYWIDSARLVWANKGKRIDDGETVTIFLFNPKLTPADVENSLQNLKAATRNLRRVDSGAQKLESGVITYVVFKGEKENKSPEKEMSPRINVPKAKVISKTQRSTVTRFFAALFVVFLFLGCFVIVYAGLPVIQSLIQPPAETATITPTATFAPTPTLTPTPQIFIITADTTVKNFVTGESFVITKDSKIIIVNPTHTDCEVLADWNGTQVIIPAKVIYPERNCP